MRAADAVFDDDAAGQVASRVDGSGTTTCTSDRLNRLLTRTHTPSGGGGGGAVAYGYDKASDQTSVTDGRGTTTRGETACRTCLTNVPGRYN